MDSNKKYQRRLKRILIQKHFHNVTISYSHERDVYEARKNGKLIHACYAYAPIGQIIADIHRKRFQ